MTTYTLPPSKISHLLLWSTAILYLLFSPSLKYHLFAQQEGKPLEVLNAPPEENGKIKYSLRKNLAAYKDDETYIFQGWAFINEGPDARQAGYDRFVVIYNESNAYLFPTKIDLRPEVQKAFQDLGLSDLKFSGFYAVISRNALPVGEYKIGLLFRSKENTTSYYKTTNRILDRTPNHLLLLPKK
jgi:hypothetical protein